MITLVIGKVEPPVYILLCDDTWKRYDDAQEALQAEKDAMAAGIEFVALIEGEVL